MTTTTPQTAGKRAKRVRMTAGRRPDADATTDKRGPDAPADDQRTAPDRTDLDDRTGPTSTTDTATAADRTATTSTTDTASAADQTGPTSPTDLATTTIAQLQPDPHNRRKHPTRNLALIADALQHVGAARSIVIDEANVVLAGNGVVDAARTHGLTKLHVVDVDGDTLVAVRRRGLSIAQKRELALYDNRTGELAEWNADQLDIDFKAGLNFAPFFTDQELAKLLPDNDAAQQTRVDNPAPQYLIIVTCTDEVQQTDVLEQLLKDGLECRAVVS